MSYIGKQRQGQRVFLPPINSRNPQLLPKKISIIEEHLDNLLNERDKFEEKYEKKKKELKECNKDRGVKSAKIYELSKTIRELKEELDKTPGGMPIKVQHKIKDMEGQIEALRNENQHLRKLIGKMRKKS